MEIGKGIIIKDREGKDLYVAESFEALTRSMQVWCIVQNVIVAGDKFCDYFYDMDTNRVALVENEDDTDGKWREATEQEVKWFEGVRREYLESKRGEKYGY